MVHLNRLVMRTFLTIATAARNLLWRIWRSAKVWNCGKREQQQTTFKTFDEETGHTGNEILVDSRMTATTITRNEVGYDYSKHNDNSSSITGIPNGSIVVDEVYHSDAQHYGRSIIILLTRLSRGNLQFRKSKKDFAAPNFST